MVVRGKTERILAKKCDEIRGTTAKNVRLQSDEEPRNCR